MLWPRGYTQDLYAYYESNKTKGFHDAENRYVKAIDSNSGQIVAVSEWTFALDVGKQANKDAVDPYGQPPDNWPINGNWELRRFFERNTEKWVEQHLSGKPYISRSLHPPMEMHADTLLVLNILVTHPDFQHRGVATKLLNWGVEQADRLGVVMALESTPAGLEMYKRVGFREVDVIKADMKRFGWNEPYDQEAAKRVWMIRQLVT